MFMNEWEVEEVSSLLAQAVDVPNMRAASVTLVRFVSWVNANSDGWPYWQAPKRAAARLVEVLHDVRPRYIRGELEDLTDAELKKLYTPIKTFLTKQGVDHEIVFPTPKPPETPGVRPTTSIEEEGDGGFPYAISELDGVRVMLYRNPGGWTSVQVETDTDEALDNLRVMLNDADLHEGSDLPGLKAEKYDPHGGQKHRHYEEN